MSLVTAITRRSMQIAQGLGRQHSLGAMNSLVLVTRAGGFDPSTGEYDLTSATVIYEDPDYPGIGGQAGVTVTSGPITMQYGDEPEYYDTITVYLPTPLPTRPQIDDLVQYMAGPEADLVGRYFRVTAVPSGGRLVPSTTLQCVGIAPSKQWVAP